MPSSYVPISDENAGLVANKVRRSFNIPKGDCSWKFYLSTIQWAWRINALSCKTAVRCESCVKDLRTPGELKYQPTALTFLEICSIRKGLNGENCDYPSRNDWYCHTSPALLKNFCEITDNQLNLLIIIYLNSYANFQNRKLRLF